MIRAWCFCTHDRGIKKPGFLLYAQDKNNKVCCKKCVVRQGYNSSGIRFTTDYRYEDEFMMKLLRTMKGDLCPDSLKHGRT